MKPEAQRIAIAESCGVSIYGHWRCPSCNREVSPSFVTFAETHDGCGHPVEWIESPDYLTDLNAMHEAERVKEMQFDSEYAYWLAHVAVRDRGLNEDRLVTGEGYIIALTSTSAQRAEAFLRTIGKWEEST